jgi:hypothetical protein
MDARVKPAHDAYNWTTHGHTEIESGIIRERD